MRFAAEHCGWPISDVLSGHSGDVDLAGEQWAKEHGIAAQLYHADWDEFGKSAGPIRNEQMARVADRVIVIWDGKSKGTRNMLQLARHYNLKCCLLNTRCMEMSTPNGYIRVRLKAEQGA